MNSPIITFDIETVPDVDTGRRLHGLEGLDDGDVARAMLHLRMQQRGHDFLPLHQHRVVAIAVTIRDADGFRVKSIGNIDDDEATVVNQFFRGIEHYRPTLVSWNGSGFDLPVLHYRCLLHGIAAPHYWETGNGDREMKWNNYISRYHERHTDLMDIISLYQPGARAPLDEVAVMLGYPGKMGMHGSHVWDSVQAGELEAVRNYCETDVLNTWLVYLRFELMRGRLSESELATEYTQVREALREDGRAHLAEFDAAWKG